MSLQSLPAWQIRESAVAANAAKFCQTNSTPTKNTRASLWVAPYIIAFIVTSIVLFGIGLTQRAQIIAGFSNQLVIPRLVWFGNSLPSPVLAQSEANDREVPLYLIQQSADINKNVSQLRGEVTGIASVIRVIGKVTTDAGVALIPHDAVAQGTTVLTGPGSFVNLLFTDHTQINIGPNSIMKVEYNQPIENNQLSLLSGTIRAAVKKVNRPSANTEAFEKLLIKTKSAAMGVRGTDFTVSFSELNGTTTLVTLEGKVAINKLNSPGDNPFLALRNANGLRFVDAGMSSYAKPELPYVSMPEAITEQQIEKIRTELEILPVGIKTYEWIKAPPQSLQDDKREFPDF